MNDLISKRLLDKVDKIDESIKNIEITVAKQHISLKEHMRRTDLAEKNHELLRAEVKPVKEHVQRIEGALKLLGLLALGITIITGILKLTTFF